MATAGLPFDDRDGFIWYDGRLVPWRDAKLHVLTHGLHYASCVFEGERVYNGKVFRLEDHNARLINSAKILGFEIPASMDDLTKATLTEWRIDQTHSNAHSKWQSLGSPAKLDPDQRTQIEAAARLDMIQNAVELPLNHGTADLKTDLPRQAVSLIEIKWVK